ncbi:MAG: hypothetical protein IJL07_01940 [Lachnospiraceae bacterium]|nr:hypothetical protein [Lachnospiraceae bacterium]
MNGFTIMAESYRKAVDQNQISREEAEPKIRAYDFLGSCSGDDFYTLFDSSAFNEIAKSYMRLAVRELVEDGTLDEDQGTAVRNRFAFLFDEKQAKEVCEG